MREWIRRQGSRVWRAQWPIYCEIILFAFLDLLYEVLRAVIAPDVSGTRTAVANAHGIVRLERALAVGMEAWSQRVTDAVAGGRFVATWYYSLAYFALYVGFFLLMWLWRRTRYAFVRNWFWTAHAIGLVVFWAYPVAPPRLAAAGLVDTTKHALTLGGALDWFQHLRNEYAAMPSLHIGQSFLFALTLCSGCARRGGRLAQTCLWILPLWMAWVTTATANHYVLDGIGGIVTVLGALAVVNWVSAADIRGPAGLHDGGANRYPRPATSTRRGGSA